MRKKIFEIVEIADLKNRMSKVYDCFMMVCIVASIIPLFFKQSYPVFLFAEKIIAGIFILDYILRWITADYKFEKHGAWAFVLYPFTFFAIIDLLSVLPVITALNSGFKLLKLLRMAKVFKVFKLLRYSKSFTAIVDVIKKEKRALSAVCVLAGGYILISALVMFQVEPDSFENFFDAVYWAVVTLTTVGYGDVYPVSDIGRIVGMLSSFMGIAIVALPTGIITAGYMNELELDKQKNQEQQDMK